MDGMLKPGDMSGLSIATAGGARSSRSGVGAEYVGQRRRSRSALPALL